MKSPVTRAALWSLPVLALLLGWAWTNPQGNFWGTVEPPKAQGEAFDATKLATVQRPTVDLYAAEKLNRLIREPQNTVSNLAYATVGLALCLAGRRRETYSLGAASAFLAVGSGLYHASLVPEWRLIDILGVYAVLYCLVVMAAKANWPRLAAGALGWALDVGAWVLAVTTGIFRNDVRIAGFKVFDSTYVVVAAVALSWLLVLGVARRQASPKKYRRAVVGAAFFSAGSFAGGLGDRFGGFWLAPDAFVQGHAVWHVLGAFAVLAVYEALAGSGLYRSTCEH
ncbi:MAG: ceramidase domain-containing protein [Opitutae bacterium]|nr:ceramidase domain-containing protein [Opitutae bacterium]